MSKTQITGKIKEVHEVQSFENSKKQMIVVSRKSTDKFGDDSEKFYAVELWNKEILKADAVGKKVIIEAFVQSNESKEKPGNWFTSINCHTLNIQP